MLNKSHENIIGKNVSYSKKKIYKKFSSKKKNLQEIEAFGQKKKKFGSSTLQEERLSLLGFSLPKIVSYANY